MRVTEATLQAVIMRWCMSVKHHEYVIPNSNTFINYSSETDLISVTKSGLVHEYEMKISKNDYNRDAKKSKFAWGYLGNLNYAPAYFWYVTYGFDIIPPEKAGWIDVFYNEKRFMWDMTVKKDAPQLNKLKMGDEKAIVAARLLSWRISNMFGALYTQGLRDKPEKSRLKATEI